MSGLHEIREDIRELRRETNLKLCVISDDIKSLSKQTTINKVIITNSTKMKLLVLSAIIGGASSLFVGFIKYKIGV